jgi:hypothetical protein
MKTGIIRADAEGMKNISVPMRIFCREMRQYREVVKGGEVGCFLGWLGVGGYGKC